MPKAKPDQVIVHRIELQEKEREALNKIASGVQFRNSILPIALTGGVVAAAYISYKESKRRMIGGKILLMMRLIWAKNSEPRQYLVSRV